MNYKNYDIIEDLKPRSWLSRYHKTTIPYLVKMAFFYYAIGVILQIIGNQIVQYAISGYMGPSLPYSISIGLTSGPVEETLFFGLPYYLSGNPYLVLATGTAWSIGHIFNTEVLQITHLAFGNFLFTVPHIFFSLRTWKSGKGWFAIVFHSAWNVTFLVSHCIINGNFCILIGDGWYFLADVISIIAAILLIVATYKLYKRKSIEINKE